MQERINTFLEIETPITKEELFELIMEAKSLLRTQEVLSNDELKGQVTEKMNQFLDTLLEQEGI